MPVNFQFLNTSGDPIPLDTFYEVTIELEKELDPSADEGSLYRALTWAAIAYSGKTYEELLRTEDDYMKEVFPRLKTKLGFDSFVAFR